MVKVINPQFSVCTLTQFHHGKRLSLFQKRLAGVESPWILNPKKSSVEDRLGQYVAGNKLQESPAHSFILDTGDPDLMALFEDGELETIMGVVQELPEPDGALRDYLDLFLNVSLYVDLSLPDRPWGWDRR